MCGSHILSSAGFLVFLLPVKSEKGFSLCGKICQLFHITKKKTKHPASYLCELHLLYIFAHPHLASCVIIQLLVEDVVAG
jgi:hypothetical protein